VGFAAHELVVNELGRWGELHVRSLPNKFQEVHFFENGFVKGIYVSKLD
jgi:hypothetical protein